MKSTPASKESLGLILGAATCTALALFPVCLHGQKEPGAVKPQYAITALETGADGSFLEPNGLNNRGAVIGSTSQYFPLELHAFLYQRGQWIDLNAFIIPNKVTYAYDLNDSGQVLLWYRLSEGDFNRPFIYRRGQMQPFSEWAGHPDIWPLAINDRGHIVGSSRGEAILYAKGQFQFLGKLPGSNSGGNGSFVSRTMVGRVRPFEWIIGLEFCPQPAPIGMTCFFISA